MIFNKKRNVYLCEETKREKEKIYLKKKQTSRRQEDSMLSNFKWHPVLVPDDVRLWDALGFAVYRDWIVAWHCCINRMLDYSRNMEGCKKKNREKSVKKCFAIHNFSPF